MAVLLENGYVTDTPLNHARIGYMDHVASATSTSGDGSLATTWQTYERWIPESSPATLTAEFDSAPVSYIGVGAHTLGAADSVVFEVKDGGSWVQVQPATVPEMVAPDNEAIMLLINERTITGVRITVEYSGEAPTVAKLAAGKVLTMARPFYSGHSPIMLSRNTTRRPTVSEAGEWLGTTLVRQGRQTAVEWNNLKAPWYRQFFDPFVSHAQRYPFFFAWNPKRFPDCAYAMMTSDANPSNSGTLNYMSVSINVRAYSDGTEPNLSKYPAAWADIFPEIELQSSIIDLTVNQEWPTA